MDFILLCYLGAHRHRSCEFEFCHSKREFVLTKLHKINLFGEILKMTKISPSILAADFTRLGADITSVEEAGADMLHLDVMDGIFVPNISFGIPVIASARRTSSLFFDVHLMITEPIRYVNDFAKAGADLITVHAEACEDTVGALKAIRALGLKSGVSIKPGTSVSAISDLLCYCDFVLVMSVEPGFGGQKFMPSALEKISELTALKEDLGLSYEIEVDGGINEETARLCTKAGATVLVAGSSVFGSDDRKAAIDALRN